MAGRMAGVAVDSREAARARRRLVRAETRRRGGKERALPSPPSVPPERSRRPRDTPTTRAERASVHGACGSRRCLSLAFDCAQAERRLGVPIRAFRSPLRPPRLCPNPKLRVSASPREQNLRAIAASCEPKTPAPLPPLPYPCLLPTPRLHRVPIRTARTDLSSQAPWAGDGGPMPR